jgi:SAM-dependent methyltransferase
MTGQPYRHTLLRTADTTSQRYRRTLAEMNAESYYDSSDADRFYGNIWGGEDIHVGIYHDDECSIREASRHSVVALANHLDDIGPATQIYDLGAGYGGAARYLARRFDCNVVCVNLSKVQNQRNRLLNHQQGLDENIKVLHGSFELIPAADASVDVIWSQDSFLHSGRRHKMASEIVRVLKPGGRLVFTDPMQADGSPAAALSAVCERLNLESLAAPGWYRNAFGALGLQLIEWCDHSHELRTHYARVQRSLRCRYDELARGISHDYLDSMLVSLDNWVTAASAGHLRWGIFHFAKPLSAEPRKT